MVPARHPDDTPGSRYPSRVTRVNPVREGRGTAGGIGAVLVFGFVFLPALLVPLLFLFFTIMGMIKGTEFRASTLNLPILFVGVVLIVTMLVVLLLAGAGTIGRSLTPKKRERG
jgi:hypothetical protein